jgi:hypothetical protein
VPGVKALMRGVAAEETSSLRPCYRLREALGFRETSRVSTTIERELIGQAEEALELYMRFVFDPDMDARSIVPSDINISDSERFVTFVRQRRGLWNRIDLVELATRVDQLAVLARAQPGGVIATQIGRIADRLAARTHTAISAGTVDSVDELIAEIRELRQLAHQAHSEAVKARAIRSTAAAPSLADGAQLLEGVSNFIALIDERMAVLKRCAFGSPFELISIAATSGGIGLRLLFYGAKRLYGFDLEVRAYREELRVRFERAKAEARELERRPADDDERRALDVRLAAPALRAGPWRGKAAYASETEDRD